ncbi:MAG TPA: hypothetical protein VK843_13130 [Planctomycetota bacterium]|nr:hypothetical protein [Planctomycetota bacterium]
MEIRNNSAADGGAKRIDITKANREAIRDKNPSPPKVDVDALNDGNRAKRVKDARARFAAAAHQKEVAQARGEFSHDKRVKSARNEFHVEKRVAEARARLQLKSNSEDTLTLSSSPAQSSEVASGREKRVIELKAQYGSGKLDVESLVAETAFRMLSGE